MGLLPLALRGWCAAVLTSLAASLRSGQPAEGSGHPAGDHPRIKGKVGRRYKYDVPVDMPWNAQITYRGKRWSPSGWVKKREPHHRAYYDLHIPKTAGCSFPVDAIKYGLSKGEGYHSKESCFPVLSRQVTTSDRTVAFLRNPQSHVYSQYLECKYDQDLSDIVGSAEPWTGDNASAILKNLTTWLRHFRGGLEWHDLHCYNPFNMQTRAFLCKGSSHQYNWHQGLLNETVASKNLDSMFFVGIVEHYQASICLFFSKTQVGKPLPRFCNCRDKEAWGSFNATRVTHGVPPHSLRDLTEEDRALINNLTLMDQKLYKHAKQRFMYAVRDLELRVGIKIVCEDHLE